ncbi:MAG: hypothetical protein M1828_003141 [Chrysothrix sp. TS-e1954]|nr:MAG: hypothetical protein M1828_003141 [Chrysothrix sp. TS-e1954]
MAAVERKGFDLEAEKQPVSEPQSPENIDNSGTHDAYEPHEAKEDTDQTSDHISTTPNADHDEPVLQERPPASRTISTQSRPVPVKKVPRSSRAGLLGRFSVLYEAEEPKHYPRRIKWFITFVIALAAVAAPMGSSLILPALNDITRDFDTTPFIANTSIATYMLSMSVFPLWWSSFSETLGRRTIYIASFTLLALWNILAAISTSISMFIVMRILSGGAAAAVQAVGAGTIADVWEVHERGQAMGIFYLGPLCGPLLAPVIGGALTEWLGWRSTQWFGTIYGGVVLLLVVFFLPETHRTSAIKRAAGKEAIQATALDAEKGTTGETSTAIPPSLSRATSHASRVSGGSAVAIDRTRRYLAMARRMFLDPLKIILYLRYPPVALTVYYAAIAFGSLYFLNISIEKTFSHAPYNFSVIIIGCLYIFNSTGYFITSVLGGRWVDRIMARAARKAGRFDSRGKLQYRPIDRMGENVWAAGILMPVSLMWYGWTANYGVYWLAPMCANFCFGAGSMLLFGSVTTMLTEFMPKQASNGVALNNFVRNILAFVGVFAAEPGIDGVGNGWLFTIIGLIALASCLVIVAMRRWGEQWGDRMRRELG